jgi:transcriptional regulator with XRE-family HTH domain
MHADDRPPRTKQPKRPHFIPEWADARGLTQAELAKAVGVDKSNVSRWYSGASPGEEMQERLSAFFGCEPESLFRHPNEFWLAQFFNGRSEEEIKRIKQTLEVAFPRPRARE